MIILNSDDDEIEVIISNKNVLKLKGSFRLNKSKNISIENFCLKKKRKKIKMDKEEFLTILKKEKVIVSNKNDLLKDFLKQENIKYENKYFCDNCIIFYRVTLLSQKNAYHLNKEHYCRKCADFFVQEEIDTYKHYYYNFCLKDVLMDKYHDLNLISNIVVKDNPITNPELTFVDSLEATQNNYEKISSDDLDIPQVFKEILNNKIEFLYPVQQLAIKNGLFDNENLLIVSSTASGKTLIGELAGIPKALNNKKMIYLSPLVALANQKYRDFKRDYEKLGLKVIIKVGSNRVKVEDELYLVEESISDADIIVATYESLDYILRSGKYELLKDLGTVIIDEIQMLEDEERGHRLNGLVNRLLKLFPSTQLIALSATIKNDAEIAKAFSMKLIRYNKRPVRIERHIFPLKKDEKNDMLCRLCTKEFSTLSSKNFRGQSIIFTDSRKNTNSISEYLNKNGVKSAAYHAGLTYKRKIEIEEEFLRQDISTIVTTSALGSGVDFPASLVIFESLRMGYDWISNNMFHQMLGRAGRPSYHDNGKIYLLPTINEYNCKEYDIALNLLKNDVEMIDVLYDVDDVLEEVLSDICAMGRVCIAELEDQYNHSFLALTFNEAIDELIKRNLITYSHDEVKATNYGYAVAKSFISVLTAEFIRTKLDENILETVLELKVIKNVYLDNKLVANIKKYGLYDVNVNLFSENNKNYLFEGNFFQLLNDDLRNKIINLHDDFLLCDCKSSPNCNCLEKNISEHIINRRLQGWTPSQISKEFIREYNLLIYNGDIYTYLDQVIRVLDSIRRIAKVFNAKSTCDECIKLIKNIEG